MSSYINTFVNILKLYLFMFSLHRSNNYNGTSFSGYFQAFVFRFNRVPVKPTQNKLFFTWNIHITLNHSYAKKFSKGKSPAKRSFFPPPPQMLTKPNEILTKDSQMIALYNNSKLLVKMKNGCCWHIHKVKN